MSERPRASAEGIYRRVTVRMYGDERFMRLSPQLPSGQALWIYLLTGPHTMQIPGVFRVGRAALAEALEWEPEAFEKALAEVIAEGLAEFDAKTRMWFIPNAIKHNVPPNPNVVKSWRAQWHLLPECAFRDRIYAHLLEALTAVSDPFGKAFDEACGKAFGKPFEKALPKGMAKQEQEQEQEKEKRPSVSSAAPTVPSCPYKELLALFATAVPELPRPRAETWTSSRSADAMRLRWKWVLTETRESGERYATTTEEGVKWFGKFFDRVAASDFLTGRDGKWTKCSLQWLMKPENFAKVVDGNYTERAAA